MNLQNVCQRIEEDPVAAYIKHIHLADIAAFARIPEYMHGGLVRYILAGIPPGAFLLSVLAGERALAEVRADDTNKHLLDLYDEFLANEAPHECWGSAEKVRAWCEQGGLIGRGRDGD